MYRTRIPETANKIKIDIGLSYNAPNSAVWLNSEPTTFVIGVEPGKEAVQSIITNGLIAHQTGDRVSALNPHFSLIHSAVGNVEIKKVLDLLYEFPIQKFYLTKGDVGTSSLLKPIKFEIEKEYNVQVIPLWCILEGLDWDRFDYVELLKIDTQGNDLEVIKSAGDWLDKVVYLHCEINTHGEYEGEPNPNDYNEYLAQKGFKVVSDGSIVNGVVVDRLYVNQRWLNVAEHINPFVL